MDIQIEIENIAFYVGQQVNETKYFRPGSAPRGGIEGNGKSFCSSINKK